MSDSNVIARAIIEIGATGVDDAKDEIQTLEARLGRLEAEYKKGDITLAAYAKRTQNIKDEIKSLQGGIDTATVAMQKYGNAQEAIASLDQRSTGRMKNTQMGLLELSRAFEDAQYGLRGVLNNIPTTIQMFGGPAGLAAGVSFVAVAFNMLLPKITEILSEMGLFGAVTEKVAGEINQLNARIKELEAKPVKLAVDTFEIDQAKKKLGELEAAKRAFDKLGETTSPSEKESGAQVASQFAGLDAKQGDAIQAALKGKMTQELLGQSQTIKNVDKEEARAVETQKKAELRLQSAGSAGGQMQAVKDVENAKARVEAAKEASRKARYEITKEGGEAEQKVGEIWSEATKGNVEAQKKLVERLMAIGEDALAMAVQQSSPESQDRSRSAAADAAVRIANEDAAAARKKVADDLARQQSEGLDAANRADYDKYHEQRQNENARLAGAMKNSVGQKYLENGDMSEGDMKVEIKKAMQKAGMGASEISQALDGTAKKLRENLDKAVKDRALDRGVSEGTARSQLAKEAKDLDKRQENRPKSEVMSTESYLSKALVAGLSKSANDIPEKQLTEQQTTNKKLDDVIKKLDTPKSGPATFARGRA